MRRASDLRHCVLSLSVALLASPASAAPRVSVSLDGCIGLRSDEVQKLVALDLQDEPLANLEANISCSSESIHLTVDVLPGSQHYQRALSPRSIQESGAERTLAVTLSQMVLAERFALEVPEPEPARAPALTPRVPTPARDSTSAVPSARDRRNIRVDANLSMLRRGTLEPLTSRAFGIGIVKTLPAPFAVETRASYEYGMAERSLGSVSIRAAWLELGPQLYRRFGVLELRVGANAALGWANLEGQPGPQALAADANGLVAQGELSFIPAITAGPVLLLGRGALGYGLSTLSARVRNEPDVSLGGAFFEVGIGAGFEFAP